MIMMSETVYFRGPKILSIKRSFENQILVQLLTKLANNRLFELILYD